MLKKPTPLFLAFLQATGLVVYISLVVTFINWVEPSLRHVPDIFMPPVFLLTFIISAVVSATLVLGNAGVLFWNKKYKEAFTLLGLTLMWAFLYLVALIFLFGSRYGY